MSHSQNKESIPEEDDHAVVPAVSEAKKNGPETTETTDEIETKESMPEFDAGMAGDARFSQLMKMQSQFVTEEALRSTEEKSQPAPPEEEPPEEDDDFDDDYEDDDYEDDERQSPDSDPLSATESAEPEAHQEAEVDTDHRVARLRKLRTTFVTEKDLEVSETTSDEPEVYREVKMKLVICPNCQAEESRFHKICSKCGAKLPNITAVEEEKYNPGTLNKAVTKYYDAVKKLRTETWTIDEFVNFMHEREELSRTRIDDLLEFIEECGSSEWLPDATKLILESTLMLEDAIAIMIDKVEEVKVDHAEWEAAESDLQDDDEMAEPILTLEEKILEIDFQPELDSIKKSNDMMLETLKQIDQFQKQSQDELEVDL